MISKTLLMLFVTFFYSISLAFSSELAAQDKGEKTVTVVVENRNGKKLPDDVDVFLASVVGGLETVEAESKKVGLYNCDCSYMSTARGHERTTLSDKELKWQAYDIRLGKNLSKDFRIDFIYLNEGRPYNNHRDGFALNAVYDLDLSKKLKLEFGTGPYLSMDTTSHTFDITNQTDDKHFGILSTIAALYSLDQITPGMHLRAEYNHVSMPGSFNTDSILIGLGMNLDTPAKAKKDKAEFDAETEVALMWDHFKTNHHVTKSADGFQLEGKRKLSENTNLSVSYIKEGKDSLVDRQGVAAQYWYAQKLDKGWTVSAGAGPYIAKNKLSSNKESINALISFEFKKDLTKNESFFVRLNRIADFDGSNDRDVFIVGISGKLK